jgi:hypothetical protein
MGCGDMPHLRKCFCKNGYKHRVPEMEFSTLFVIAFWAFWISLAILVALVVNYILVNFVLILGGLPGEPTRVINETKPLESHQHLLLIYDFQIEPVKAQVQNRVGCEYWEEVISGLEATPEEKSWLSRIAYCESTCNPNAVSYMNAQGLLQFTLPTWEDFGGNRDINNPYHQLEVGLEMYRKGLQSRWCCNKLI